MVVHPPPPFLATASGAVSGAGEARLDAKAAPASFASAAPPLRREAIESCLAAFKLRIEGQAGDHAFVRVGYPLIRRDVSLSAEAAQVATPEVFARCREPLEATVVAHVQQAERLIQAKGLSPGPAHDQIVLESLVQILGDGRLNPQDKNCILPADVLEPLTRLAELVTRWDYRAKATGRPSTEGERFIGSVLLAGCLAPSAAAMASSARGQGRIQAASLFDRTKNMLHMLGLNAAFHPASLPPVPAELTRLEQRYSHAQASLNGLMRTLAAPFPPAQDGR